MKSINSLLVFVSLFGLLLAGKIPSDFKICPRDDKLNACMAQALDETLPKIGKGIESLKIPPCEPLLIPSATIGEGKGAVHVSQHYKNLYLHGLTKAVKHEVELNIGEKEFTLQVKAESPEYHIEADYTMDGQILLVPIKGEGKCIMNLKNTKVTINLDGEVYTKNGKEHMKITKTSLVLDPELVYINFGNLFNGDEMLEKQINTLLNENWKEVFADVQPQWGELIGKIYANYMNNVFSEIPIDEMFPKP